MVKNEPEFKQGDLVTYYCRVNKKEVNGTVEFAGEEHCIVTYNRTRYSIRNWQLTLRRP